MMRFGHVIRVQPGMLERYTKLHANVWPENLKLIRDSNLRNYSIYSIEDLLFSYYEYTGADFAADMAKIGASTVNAAWQAEVRPCFLPLASRKPGETWARMDEIFHMD